MTITEQALSKNSPLLLKIYSVSFLKKLKQISVIKYRYHSFRKTSIFEPIKTKLYTLGYLTIDLNDLNFNS